MGNKIEKKKNMSDSSEDIKIDCDMDGVTDVIIKGHAFENCPKILSLLCKCCMTAPSE